MMEELVLKSDKGTPITNSLLVAQKFRKTHKNVIRDIKNLTAQNCAVRSMFVETTYTSQRGRSEPMYIMNRDGFTLLAMGFTGKEALQFKIDYINAFNKMEGLVKQVMQNQIYMAQNSAKQRFIKSNRIKEIDTTINNMLKERRILVKEVNQIDRSDFLQLSFPFLLK